MFRGSRHPRKFITYENLLSMKILMPLKQNGRGRGNICGSASVHHKTREYSESIRRGSGKKGTVVGHSPQKISCVCALFLKKRGGIHCRSNWMTEVHS